MNANEKIKIYRAKLGMTQSELAKRAGYTDRSSIAKIESGVVDLPQSKIKVFADIFDVPPADLIGWDCGDNNVIADAALRMQDDPKFREAVELMGSLQPDELSAIVTMIRTMRK